MNKEKPLYRYVIKWAIIGAILGPMILMVPFFGAFLFMPLRPLIEAYDSVIPGGVLYSEQHVINYFGFGIILVSGKAFVFFASFYAYIGAVIGLSIGLLKSLPQKISLAILVATILLCLGYLAGYFN
jgi:hypothetical protein